MMLFLKKWFQHLKISTEIFVTTIICVVFISLAFTVINYVSLQLLHIAESEEHWYRSQYLVSLAKWSAGKVFKLSYEHDRQYDRHQNIEPQ